MINGLPPDDSGVVTGRLSPDIIDLTLERVAVAIHSPVRGSGAAALRRLRITIDRCSPQGANGIASAALPDILGTTVTLQYPLTQLELYLSGEHSDIGDANQAEMYLSFVRYHLWKLEHLLRESVPART